MLRFFHKDDLKNRVDWLYILKFPHKKSIVQWAVISLELFIVLFLVIVFFQARANTRLSGLKEEFSKGEKSIARLQKKTKRVSISEAVHRDLKQKFKNRSLFVERHNIIVGLFRDISHLIPQNTWIERFLLEPKSVKKKRRRVFKSAGYRLRIDGCSGAEGDTSNYNEIVSFFSLVSGIKSLKNCCLKYDFLDSKSSMEGDTFKNVKFVITADLCFEA